jgi:hypothetical protein
MYGTWMQVILNALTKGIFAKTAGSLTSVQGFGSEMMFLASIDSVRNGISSL